jgi:hypothetical protein
MIPADFISLKVNAPCPDGFHPGEFSDIEFSEWLGPVSGSGSPKPHNAKVTTVGWWSSHVAPWHHQFITVNVIPDGAGTNPVPRSYTLTFERLGKLVEQKGTAKQQIAVKDLVPWMISWHIAT